MKRFLAAIMSVAVVATVAPVVDAQQTQCPVEVSQAQAMLKKVSKAQDVQAPRSLAGARQDIQAARQPGHPGSAVARRRPSGHSGPARWSGHPGSA